MAAQGDYDAVFFDFGGTLFSYRSVRWDAGGRPLFLQAAERLGVDATPEEIGRAYGVASRDAWSRYATQAYYLHRDVFLDSFRGFAEALGAAPDDEFLAWFYDQQRVALVEGFELRPDCADTLRRLRDAGHYLSIVSNIDDDYLHPMVERAGLEDVLHHWTSSEEAQSCKPDPGFFHVALEKSGHGADAVLFVGDSPTHDVAGARAVGMQTVLIREEGAEPPGQTGDAPEPHHEIRELAELLRICGVG